MSFFLLLLLTLPSIDHICCAFNINPLFSSTHNTKLYSKIAIAADTPDDNDDNNSTNIRFMYLAEYKLSPIGNLTLPVTVPVPVPVPVPIENISLSNPIIKNDNMIYHLKNNSINDKIIDDTLININKLVISKNEESLDESSNDVYNDFSAIKFRNLNDSARHKFFLWINLLPRDKLCLYDTEELDHFISIYKDNDYAFLVTNRELIVYCIVGNVDNYILQVNGLFRNYMSKDSNLTFLKFKEQFVNYLQSSTSDIQDIDLNHLMNTRYKRYIFEYFIKY